MKPELSLYLAMTKKDKFPASLDNVFDMMQFNRFFNLEIIGDIVLKKQDVDYDKTFINDAFGQYLRYVMIEVGLGGMF